MKRLIFALIFCSSCQQGQNKLSNWWGGWKDYAITYMASESSSYLNSVEKNILLDLFYDLKKAKSCGERQNLIESNSALKNLQKNYNLLRGWLFDALFNYDYERAIAQIRDRSLKEQAAFTVVNVWKTSATIEEINQVIDQVSKCYPSEYVD